MNRRQRRARAKLSRIAKGTRAGSAADSLPLAVADIFQAGLRHYQAGQLGEAETCYRRVLAIQPHHSGVLCNFGAVLHKQGKLDEAIAAYRKAIKASPHYALPHANLGTALSDQGKFEEAAASFREAVRIDPNYQHAYFHLGIVLRNQRKFDDAISAFQHAIHIKPDYAEAHCNLGIAFYEQGKVNEAIKAHRKAIDFKPYYAAPYYNLGLALYRQGKFDNSISAYRKAVALKSDLADAHNALGVALMDVGRLSEARESFEQAVRLVPDNARYRRGVSIITRFVPGDPRVTEMEQLTKCAASRSIEDRIELHFALGKAYDDIGRHAEAFGHWLDGNALKRLQIEYDETATLDELDRVGSIYTAELFQASQNLGHQTSLPVFIIGMPRSGTTLVEQILASHPQVFGAGELQYFPKAVEKTLATSSGSIAATQNIHEIGVRYLAEIERLAPGVARVTDKMPRNFIFAGLIHLTLPNAAIIHAVRCPVDTCLSCFSILFTEEQDYTYDLAELGRYYRRYQSLMEHWHRVLPPGRILDVRYEDLVADLEGQARRIIGHCGLEWDPRCLAFHETERPVRTASVTQVRQPIYRSAVGRWRSYAEFLAPLLAELRLASDAGRDHEAAAASAFPDEPASSSMPTRQ